ncbi:hypothetical protein KP509_33G031200 [Ceratopteris richardii]|uniref:non-specific serine/threonine protein kinase n=1 Tax=Ceratopteris richardii TaxID=49495 RepID=A0A8T2QPJ2_CERRI|nr:hypothetical protein KP509_33G031200 [Ceratopteris richardii]KAH7285498.1 hypothetical protein KP509_33G031200 [Ceratopteris richardii]KAH7285501.1 hypothetical protein KP509_33G031200 [Ceratopteris richardii]KAH7285503.1 hypothetical protein KP509_33G031200 [Ceratopteris richardii]KAH7285504.1 hypothetical protein KP509_33G031200 [Ceratopteris richardii]
MEDSDKGEKGVKSTSPTKQRQRKKIEVCNEVLKRLREAGNDAVNVPGFEEGIHAHFQRLPARYALDVNVERAEDVLMHKRLLEEAKASENRPVFHVRAVHVLPVPMENPDLNHLSTQEDQLGPLGTFRPSVHPPPAFGSSASLEALALEMTKPSYMDEERDSSGINSAAKIPHMPMHEVTLSTLDKPKLLSQLSSLLADVGLNICEAHVFSTVDGYSLDVFVVDGWPTEDVHELQQALETALACTGKRVWSRSSPTSSPMEPMTREKPLNAEFLKIPSDGTDDWEIDPNHLKYIRKIASGSFGDLYKGTYCGQDVAIKVLKSERLNENLQREFAKEVYIMRKIRHKNVVQFIGACTRPPHLCIVTEFMAGGSVYDHLHKHKNTFKLPALLKVAIDVSRGMDYLHQCNIIHRDLKAANLLIDENEVIKVADFGVARVQAQNGVMTAETGTYRWMAPEVIEHWPYNRKADVFSFGIVLWELLTGKLPYEHLTPLQAAVGVVQKGLRPTIPKNIHPRVAELLPRCWQQDPAERPEFSELTTTLQDILKEVVEEEKKDKKGSGFFSTFKKPSN